MSDEIVLGDEELDEAVLSEEEMEADWQELLARCIAAGLLNVPDVGEEAPRREAVW
jgi:hypothetical protein